jgi:phenylacetate-CoA ligase
MNVTKITDLLTGKNVEEYYKLYHKTQWYSEAEMRKFQLNKLQKLITHCYNNVPFYTNFMDKNGIKPEDILSLDDLKLFPIITKDIIKENYNDFLPQNNIKGTKISQTGGTTGNILLKRTDANSRSSIWASFKRFRYWMNLKNRDRGLILMGGHVIGRNYKDKFKKQVNDFLTNCISFNPYDTGEENIKNIINVLKNDRITYIRSYPQFLFSLSKRLKQEGLSFKLKAITTTAEPVIQEQRDLYREIFHCETFDQYGCGEISGVAYECDKHEGLHVAEERVILETQNEFDLIITDLDNYSLPYIRYYNADQAIWSEKKCSCGRQSPLIKEIMGRTCDYTTGINGEFLHWAYYWHLFFDSKIAEKYDLKKFQVIQADVNLLIIKLVCQPLTQIEEKILSDNIQERMDKISIKFEYVDNIENTKTGKYRPVINKLIK